MTRRYVKNLEHPDEVIEAELARATIVQLGDSTIGHNITYPGWRWSIHMKPTIGTASCQTRHVGLMLSGRVAVTLDDGTALDIGPNDA